MSSVAIVDTNVVLVADGQSTASLDCQERCLEAIERITRDSVRIAVDDGGLIVEEYSHKLAADAQGVGAQFMLWIYNYQWNPERCDRVEITATDNASPPTEFEEFPNDERLAAFDRSDRKFVAVARAHADHPPIWEASDAKWVGWANALAAAGVTVELLCEHDLRAQYASKFGHAAGDALAAGDVARGGRNRDR